MSVIIREAEEVDLQLIVKCHLEAFPSFFLSLLGPKFLNCFYEAFICNKDAGLLVALERNTVVGFAAYVMNPNTFFSQLKQEKGIRLFGYALPALFKSPIKVMKKIFRGIFYRGDQVSEIHGAALLSSIGVSPLAAGKSVGTKLLTEVEACIVQSGIKQIYLTTDSDNNDATLGFYRKNGYSEHSRYKQSGDRSMLRLIKQLV